MTAFYWWAVGAVSAILIRRAIVGVMLALWRDQITQRSHKRTRELVGRMPRTSLIKLRDAVEEELGAQGIRAIRATMEEALTMLAAVRVMMTDKRLNKDIQGRDVWIAKLERCEGAIERAVGHHPEEDTRDRVTNPVR